MINNGYWWYTICSIPLNRLHLFTQIPISYEAIMLKAYINTWSYIHVTLRAELILDAFTCLQFTIFSRVAFLNYFCNLYLRDWKLIRRQGYVSKVFIKGQPFHVSIIFISCICLRCILEFLVHINQNFCFKYIQ